MAAVFPSFGLLSEGADTRLYGLFALVAIVLLLGLHRMGRRLDLFGRGKAASRGSGAIRLFANHALLQRGIRKDRFAGWIHVCLFWGFVVLLLGDLLLFVDGYVLTPIGARLLVATPGKLFQAIMDAFGIVFLVGVVLAVGRRLGRRPPRLQQRSRVLPLLALCLYLGISGFALEGIRIDWEPRAEDEWAFAGRLSAVLVAPAGSMAQSPLTRYELLWWSHAVAAFAFLVLIPYTQLRHLVAVPLHLLTTARPFPSGLHTPFRLDEVLKTGQFDVDVGAGTIAEFGVGARREFAACVDCGRCEAVCPAHASGAALSPRRLVRNLARETRSNGKAADDLFDGVVSEEEVWACTLCESCSQACPVLIHPSAHVVELRRELVSRNRLGPKRSDLLSNLTYAGNPYGLPRVDREGVAADLGVRTLHDDPDVDYLLWVGCAGTFDPRARASVKAFATSLHAAGVSFGVLGAEERCTGDAARRIGEEGKFQELALQNIETLNRYGVRRIVTTCAHCFHALHDEYRQFGASFEAVHHSRLLADLVAGGRLRVERGGATPVTLHDSCHLGRIHGDVTSPRTLLDTHLGLELREMTRSGRNSACCGGGGGVYWYDGEVPRRESMAVARVREAAASGANVLVTECPFCLRMLEGAVTEAGLGERMTVKDIGEMVASSVGHGAEREGEACST